MPLSPPDKQQLTNGQCLSGVKGPVNTPGQVLQHNTFKMKKEQDITNPRIIPCSDPAGAAGLAAVSRGYYKTAQLSKDLCVHWY